MRSVPPSLVVLVAAASATLSCQPSATVRYNGRDRPPIVTSGAAVRVIAGRAEPPEGHEVLGVITTQCTALDGATGLMEAPCTEEAMANLARERAAERGGTALFELVCGTDESDRFISGQQQAGTTGAQPTQTQSQITNTTTVRTITTCRATVLRSEDRTAPLPTATPSATPPGERVEISGQSIAIAWTPAGDAPALPEREAAEVGEMETFPSGYQRLGELRARCPEACARSVATRALKQAAGKRGALALAELSCKLGGERWDCSAALVGPALPPPKAPNTSDGGPGDGSGGGSPADATGGGSPADGAGGGSPADGAGGPPATDGPGPTTDVESAAPGPGGGAQN